MEMTQPREKGGRNQSRREASRKLHCMVFPGEQTSLVPSLLSLPTDESENLGRTESQQRPQQWTQHSCSQQPGGAEEAKDGVLKNDRNRVWGVNSQP